MTTIAQADGNEDDAVPGAGPSADAHLAALHEIALDLMNRREVRDLLDTILARAAALAGTEHGYIFVTEDGDHLRAESVLGTFEGLHGWRLTSGVGLAGKAVESGAPISVSDYDSWEGRDPDYPRGVLGSGLCVPLATADGRVIGVIGLAFTDFGRSFGEDDVERLTGFARLASIALENARLYESARRELQERARSDEALRETEESYRRLVELSPDGIVVHVDNLFVFANGRAAAMFGVDDPEDLLGLSVMGFIHPDHREPVLERRRFMLDMGTSVPLVERQFLRADGSVFDVEVAAGPMTYRGQEAIQAVFRDITQRKASEQALEEAQAKYRSLVERLPSVTYTFANPTMKYDASHNYVSPQITDLLGCEPHEWLGDETAWRAFVHPADVDAVDAQWRDAGQRGEPFDIEYRMVARDGRIVWVRERSAAVVDDHGVPRFWQGVIEDITEQREAREAMNVAFEQEREASRRLRALDEMKNTFLAAVSHELRTPLAAILGLALTLEREELELDPVESRELLRRLASNARKLNRLLSDLLDLDRLGRGILEPRRRPTDVAELVRQVIENSDAIDADRLRLDLEPVVAELDAAKVERIVENLVANAIRHTPAGAAIWIRTRSADGGVMVAVDDDGPGIPDDLRAAVFEPFRQVPGRNVHAPGVGIGLSLVARFAELHGGRAWVEPREGGGSSFRVLIPGAGPEESSPESLAS